MIIYERTHTHTRTHTLLHISTPPGPSHLLHGNSVVMAVDNITGLSSKELLPLMHPPSQLSKALVSVSQKVTHSITLPYRLSYRPFPATLTHIDISHTLNRS